MKIYVAGIKIDRSHANQSTLEKTRHVTNLLQTIQNDATTILGDDVVIVVILEEYALTPMAVPAEDKRASLALLQQAIGNFDQMMLIPGSYASYEKYKDNRQQHKSEKLTLNYRDIAASKLVPQTAYDDEIIEMNRMTRNNELANCAFLQNTAYILTAMEKHRHKKAAPFHESNKFPFAFSDHVYYIGNDDFIKHLTVHGNRIDTGLFICFEHSQIDNNALLLREPAPLLHTLVSASISMQTEKLIGALNIQMDKCSDLTVIKNQAHFRADEIEDVVANIYRTGSSKIETSRVININKPLPPTPFNSPDVDRETHQKPTLKREREDEKDINTRQYKH